MQTKPQMHNLSPCSFMSSNMGPLQTQWRQCKYVQFWCTSCCTHKYAHTLWFIFSYLLWFFYWDQVRSLKGKSEVSYGEICVHTLLKGCGTPHTSSSRVSSSEKDIIKSLQPEITKGWDAVSSPEVDNYMRNLELSLPSLQEGQLV